MAIPQWRKDWTLKTRVRAKILSVLTTCGPRMHTVYHLGEASEKEVLPGFEPGLREGAEMSESRVIATTL